MKLLQDYYWLILLIWNGTVAFLYWSDKHYAQRGAWRISERTLLLCGLLLGGVGAFAGMRLFRHKTQHLRFRILVPLFAILTVAAAILPLVWEQLLSIFP